MKNYNYSAIRELIEAAFGSEELEIFCSDHFSAVGDRFTTGQSQRVRVQLLIDYVKRHGLTDNLLSLIQKEYSYQYRRFEHSLKEDIVENSNEEIKSSNGVIYYLSGSPLSLWSKELIRNSLIVFITIALTSFFTFLIVFRYINSNPITRPKSLLEAIVVVLVSALAPALITLIYINAYKVISKWIIIFILIPAFSLMASLTSACYILHKSPIEIIRVLVTPKSKKRPEKKQDTLKNNSFTIDTTEPLPEPGYRLEQQKTDKRNNNVQVPELQLGEEREEESKTTVKDQLEIQPDPEKFKLSIEGFVYSDGDKPLKNVEVKACKGYDCNPETEGMVIGNTSDTGVIKFTKNALSFFNDGKLRSCRLSSNYTKLICDYMTNGDNLNFIFLYSVSANKYITEPVNGIVNSDITIDLSTALLNPYRSIMTKDIDIVPIKGIIKNAIFEKSLMFVGIVKTPPGSVPDECYELIRKGKLIKPLKSVVEVINGDIIVPKKGKRVRLIYEHTECGEATIENNTIVNCNSSDLFLTFFSDVWNKMKLAKHTSPLVAMVTRESTPEASCFPDNEFLVSHLPFNDSTILYGEPVLFRWDDGIIYDDIKPCSKATLLIVEEKSGKALSKENMKVGELLLVDKPFKTGTTYKWHVETEGKKSDVYQFRILEKKESDNIRSQLKPVSEKYTGQFPELAQALYLQVISDAKPGLDLYTDSVRFLKQYSKKKAVTDKMNENVYKGLIEQMHERYSQEDE